MPFFFIDTEVAGVESIDNEGLEFPDLKAARDAAMSILPDLARDELPDGADHDFKSRVRDAIGKVVFKASLKLRADYLD